MAEKKHIFLDNNSTTPIKPEVAAMMADVMKMPHNPSSAHYFGQEARGIMERARKKIAKLVGAGEAHQVIFTASGTEANNLALKGIKHDITHVISAAEHDSVVNAVANPITIPVDEMGIIKLDELQNILAEINGRVLVSVVFVNNETGVIQPIKEIAKITYAAGGYFHCDAAQAIGKIPVDIQDLNIDMLTVSAHKFGGPVGAAALIIKKGMELDGLMKGGGQELGFRSGTENIPAIAGFGVAAKLAAENLEKIDEIRQLRDYMEAEIEKYAPDAVIFSRNAERAANTSFISMPGMSREVQLISFDLAGLAVSNGSACSSGKSELSRTLLAMGVEKSVAANAIRVSLGVENSKEDVEKFIKVWKEVYNRSKENVARDMAA